jgi:AmmeMemoRadiSam system protein B
MTRIRPAAVAGTWYPGSARPLSDAVEGYLARAEADASHQFGEVTALIAPHAGLIYSGPVAAYAYQLLRGRSYEVIILVGPSHFVGFEGVSIYPAGGFQTPLGIAEIDAVCCAAIIRAAPIVTDYPTAHVKEHSLEMQLPFIQALAPTAKIVPLLMGHQTSETAHALSEALVAAVNGRRALLIASTDLSHYHDAGTAGRMDHVVLDHVGRFDADGLQRALDEQPDHACGGGPTVAVMRAARKLGARDAVVLNYADSGDVSGDKSSVVGYMAAALGIARER